MNQKHALPAGPQALGQPLDPAIADAAARWFTVLRSGEATRKELARWRAWHDAHPDHARAWRHLEAVTGALPALNAGDAARRGLAAAARARAGRRRLFGLAVALGPAIGGGYVASRSSAWGYLAADYASATGERRRFTLPDGTELLLGSASRAALHYGERERRVRLLAGEAFFTTAHARGAPDPRPFIVETAEGRVRALGTRFTVRQRDGHSRTAVIEGAVEVTTADGGAPMRLRAGEAATFGGDATSTVVVAHDSDTAWSRGLLVVDDQRLDDFLAELGRYRHGWLRADPAVASLRFSGVFPLGEPVDTDAVLAMLPNSLPVRVRSRTRWWVLVEPL